MERATTPGLVDRLGLALIAPRAALAGADRPEAAGKSATDAVVLILVAAIASVGATLVVATRLGDGRAAVSMAIGTIAGGAAGPLAFLFGAALVLYALAGPRRAFGREIDLASVAVVPLIGARLVAEVVVRLVAGGAAGGAGAPPWLPLALHVVAYAIAAAYLVPAVRIARRREAP